MNLKYLDLSWIKRPNILKRGLQANEDLFRFVTSWVPARASQDVAYTKLQPTKRDRVKINLKTVGKTGPIDSVVSSSEKLL